MPAEDSFGERALTVDDVRIVSDLRCMHTKVNDLFHLVEQLKQRYEGTVVHSYSDWGLLSQDIDRVDEIYQWFVRLREERDRHSARR